MDGLSALSVAASIAQFIEFGCSLVSKSNEIYDSAHGASIQNVESAAATKRLIELSEGMKASLEFERISGVHTSKQRESLEAICDGCIAVSAEFLTRLDRLKIQDGLKNRRWKSFRQALKSVWSKSAIDEIGKRLESFKKELDAHVLVSLSQKVHDISILQDQNFASLDATLQQNIENPLRTLIDIHNKVNEVLAIQKRSLDKTTKGLSLDCEAQRRDGDHMANAFILASLRFPTISQREEEICEAHQRTCSWIFETHMSDSFDASSDKTFETRQWSNFVEWLLNDGDVYWINGKAGSGKSTLMKYIYEHPDTMRHLQSWAGNAELRVARYYFWNGGSQDQRSHTGLLRSLLYEILNSRKDLIRQVFPDQWKEIREMVKRIKIFDTPPSCSWSFKRLEKALVDLEIASTDQFKLCLFIDGLDEYEGDPEAIIEIFHKLSMSPYIKVCSPSRPRPAFEEAFGHRPGLRLQNLTCDDIQNYIRDKLDANEKMLQLVKSDPVQAATFSRTIVSKANGVFLWVKLVVASLLNGLRNRDEIRDLQKRLEVIPSELDDLYGHMLDRIEPIYLGQASKIFQIFNSATELVVEEVTVLELELAVSSSFAQALEPAGNPMSDEEIESRCLKMRTLLKSRCEGLLETHDHRDRNWKAVDDSVNDTPETHWALKRDDDAAAVAKKLMVDWKVSYLHRTVKDYLRSDVVRAKLQRTTIKTTFFDPIISLLQSYIINLKRSVCSFYFDTQTHKGRVCMTMLKAFRLARRVNDRSNAMCAGLIHEFNIVCAYWYYHEKRPLFPHAAEDIHTPWVSREWRYVFLFSAVRFGLESYIRKCLDEHTISPPNFDNIPLLECALGLPVDYPRDVFATLRTSLRFYTTPTMVAFLLQHGADPNAPCIKNASETIWQLFLRSLHVGECNADVVILKEEALMMEAMLRSGADPKAICIAPHDCDWIKKKSYRQLSTVAMVIRDTFESRGLLDEAASVFAVLREVQLARPMKGESQCGVVSTSRKGKPGTSKKRSFTDDYHNATDDDESSRRPLKRSRRRGK